MGRFVLIYPEKMPKDGEFGENEDAYTETFGGAYVVRDGANHDYPAPVKDIQRATWFDSKEEAETYAGNQKHFKAVNVASEIAKAEKKLEAEQEEQAKEQAKQAKEQEKQARADAKRAEEEANQAKEQEKQDQN